MGIRIATTVEEDHLKLVKVRACRACPNATEAFQESEDIGEDIQKDVYCDLHGTKIVDLDVIKDGCPLPSLWDISQQVGKSA